MSKEAEVVGLDMLSLKEISTREAGIINTYMGV